jgi:NitT/TauT family transport system substrate-binding protein
MARCVQMVFAFVAVMVICGSSSRVGAENAAPLTVLHISGVPSDAMAPLTYAQRSGLFRRAGLDVQFTKATSGSAVVAAVMSGNYEIGHSSLIAIFNAYLKGLPVTVVAGGAIYDDKSPYAELIVAADSPYKTGADLSGKLVGVSSLNDLTTMGTSAWVDANGGDARTLKFVEIPMSAAAVAVQEHRIDAAIVFYPPLAAALAGGKVRVLSPAFSAIRKQFMTSVWFANNDWASKHTATVRAFNDAFQRAVIYTNLHKAESAVLTSEMTETPMAIIEKSPRMTSAPSLDLELIQPMIDAAAKYKAISRGFAANDIIFPALLAK